MTITHLAHKVIPSVAEFAREMLLGLALIMLQPSAYVGAAFLIGLCINSLTFPFVLPSWMVLWIRSMFERSSF